MTNEAIFLGPSIWPTFMNELALIDELASNVDQLDVYYCSGDRRYCSAFRDANFLKRQATCLVCKANIYSAIFSMKQQNISFRPLHFRHQKTKLPIQKFSDQGDVDWKWDRQSSVLSTLQCDFSDLDLTNRDYSQIKIDLYDDTNAIEKISQSIVGTYDQIYIYNGRTNYFDFLTQFCEKNKVDYFTYEYPNMSHSGLVCYENFRVHNYGEVSFTLLKNSKSLDCNQIEIGKTKLNSRINKKSDINQSLMPSYIKGQIKKLIPPSLKDIKFVIFYASTEDEDASIRELEEAGTLPQHEIISTLIEILGSQYRIVVKIHPNMTGSRSQYFTNILNTEKKGSLIINGDEDFDTYELMKKASLVVVKGSFTGIEASFLGKHVINVGDTYYSKFPSINTVYGIEELNSALEQFSSGKLKQDLNYQEEDAGRFMYAFWQPTKTLKNLKKFDLYAGKLEGYWFVNLVNLFTRYLNRAVNRLNK